jgi:hypothetical protein
VEDWQYGGDKSGLKGSSVIVKFLLLHTFEGVLLNIQKMYIVEKDLKT